MDMVQKIEETKQTINKRLEERRQLRQALDENAQMLLILQGRLSTLEELQQEHDGTTETLNAAE